MVYRRRRRFPARRRFRRTRRSGRRRTYRRRSFSRRRRRSPRVHVFKRTMRQSINIYNYASYSSATFNLGQVTNYTEFTQLFDQYKICMIKSVFTFGKTDAPINSAIGPPTSNQILTSMMPTFQWWIDRDDNSLPTAAEASQVERVHRTQMTHPVKVVFKPNILVMAYEGLMGTAYSPAYRWIDCSDHNTPYYGLKYIIDGSGSGRVPDVTNDTIIGVCTIDTTYYMAFKNVR